jgi:hypothetical protein
MFKSHRVITLLPSCAQANIVEDAVKDAQGEDDLLESYGGTLLPTSGWWCQMLPSFTSQT